MSNFETISVTELNQKTDKDSFILVDVRTPEEYETANIGGILIPLNELESRYKEILNDKEIIVMCHHGGRSANACQFLSSQGYTNLKNLTGGIHSWSLEIDSAIPTY